MSRRGGRGSRNLNWRNTGRDWDEGQSSTHGHESRPGRGKKWQKIGSQGYPQGLRGKEIGFFFRDRYKNKVGNKLENMYEPRIGVHLDPGREEEIRHLLNLRRDDNIKEDVIVKQEFVNSDWDLCKDTNDVECKEDSFANTLACKRESEMEASAHKYSHVGESQFKHRFLQSITGDIEANLERSLQKGPELERLPILDERFKAELVNKQQSSRHYQKMLEFRRKLPSYNKRQEIVELIEQNPVVVINGETGCGKTTQVAQFILDDYIMKGNGSICRVVCTQPRRISAISVAERVADERDDTCGESSAGYQIRLQKKLPRDRGSILYCTTGVLLQWMQSNAGLTNISHLVLDEIHERDTISDFVITLLKNIIPKRPNLKVILMSATLNAEQFSKYYGGCPCLNIPGFTFPVKEYYLEDVLEITNFAINPYKPVEGWRKHLKHSKMKQRKVQAFEDFIQPYVRNLASEGKYSQRVLDGLLNPEIEDINLQLIFALVKHICQREGEGALLIFLPGWDKISSMHKMLTDSGHFPNSHFLIIPLHSLMPTTTQQSIFRRPPPGVRKIVIATNIAETSITIDDVVYVIDCGKIKLQNFDAEANITTLEAEWESLANARQRRGRAGRVKPGVCYHMFSRAREMTLANYTLPEMLRTRLDQVILQIKILQLGKAQPFLESVMDPPDTKAIEVSLQLLRRLNVLDENENLTPLGYHIAKLPLDPQTAKMILMGAIFGCVDPIFSVAASLSFKDAFLIPLGKEAEVDKKKFELSGGTRSDHLVLAEAFRQWERAEERGHGREFCWDYFLSSHTLSLLRDMKRQFAEHLYEMNFLSSKNPKDHDSNINSHNISLVKAIICSGLYPNVAVIHSVKRRRPRPKLKMTTLEDGPVSIHPRSINEKETEFESPFILYYMKLKSSAIYLHDTTMVYPLPLLFFGEGIDFFVENGVETIVINKGIRFWCTKSTADIVVELRKRLVSLLEYKVSHPGTTDWSLSSEEGAVLRAMIQLITYEGNQLSVHSQDDDSM